jgi:hypothetical protein
MKITPLTILLILTSSVAFSQQQSGYATFTFLHATSSGYSDLAAIRIYDSMSVRVNHTLLSHKDKAYTIKINRTGFDTIIVGGLHPYKIDTIITKLKTGGQYTVNFNICSMYEIGPVKRELKERLIRIITTHSSRKTLYFSSGVFYATLDTLQKVDTTFYYYIAASGYCLFSTNGTSLCTISPDAAHDTNTCSEVSIQFMDAEKYTLMYDCLTRKMIIRFDGYYDKKEKIHIVE